MKAGVPGWIRVAVSPVAKSVALATPKSITRGPVGASSTLLGLRSRWTTPAAWMATRAPATPTASDSSAEAGMGPCLATASCRSLPSTYSLAMYGTVPSRSASSTWAVENPATRPAASASRRNRSRSSGSSATSSWSTLTATRRPFGAWPR
jgi:hypothetical protein